MTRRRAALLFGGLTALNATYVAVAARPFYCKPGFEYFSSEPHHANMTVKAWLGTKSAKDLKPLPFDWNIFKDRLMKPFQQNYRRIWFSTDFASPYYSDPDSIYAKECLVIRYYYQDEEWKFIRPKGTTNWEPY